MVARSTKLLDLLVGRTRVFRSTPAIEGRRALYHFVPVRPPRQSKSAQQGVATLVLATHTGSNLGAEPRWPAVGDLPWRATSTSPENGGPFVRQRLCALVSRIALVPANHPVNWQTAPIVATQPGVPAPPAFPRRRPNDGRTGGPWPSKPSYRGERTPVAYPAFSPPQSRAPWSDDALNDSTL